MDDVRDVVRARLGKLRGDHRGGVVEQRAAVFVGELGIVEPVQQVGDLAHVEVQVVAGDDVAAAVPVVKVLVVDLLAVPRFVAVP